MIREFENRDLSQVLKIWLNSNIKVHCFIKKNYWLENYKILSEILPNSEVYVYEENNKVIAFIGINNNYIEGIFVSEDKRSNGIGKKLLDYVKNIKNELYLSVYEKNNRAIKFYLRENFYVVSKKKDKMTNQVELLMKTIVKNS